MATYMQSDRAMTVTTPLGRDDLLLVGFSGREAISQLFHFELDLLAENGKDIPFERLLGQKITIHLKPHPSAGPRHFSGLCYRVGQGARDSTFTSYRLEIVPQFWLLTRRAQSRIFQGLTVPLILKHVLAGLDVVFEIQGQFRPRDYCVQYRETDFNFASRLMEEEGLYYFFKHAADGHKMVVANTPQGHPPVPEPSTVHFQGEGAIGLEEGILTDWEKVQELRSGKYTLWDHHFELPHKHLEADKTILDGVAVGQVQHKLRVGRNEMLELYDFPGEYAQRFDGVDRGGGDRPGDLQHIFEDNHRTVEIRMQQEALPSLLIRGAGTCSQLVSGHRFTLKGHFNADGPYVVSSVQHVGSLPASYRSEDVEEPLYNNTFTCIPAALPFRPARSTPKPFVQGSQTAVVVGPPGEEIFTDKYGRVKVQFHWDREGKSNADSSCWIRVGQLWAGRRWGASFWPRVGQEVIVDFLEGDPDQPIIVGSVYNADQMPPYLGKGPDGKHPNDNKISGIKSNTSPGGKGFNELRLDDTKGKEQVFIHAERDLDERVKNDKREAIGHHRHQIVGQEVNGQCVGDQRELVYGDKHQRVRGSQAEAIGGSMVLSIGGDQDITIGHDKKEYIRANEHHHVVGNRMEKVDGDASLTVGGSHQAKVGMKNAVEAGQEIHLKAGMKVVIEAGVQVTIKGPGGFIDINPAGVVIQGVMVLINSGGAAGSGSGSSPTAPDDAQGANPTAPDPADDAVSGHASNNP